MSRGDWLAGRLKEGSRGWQVILIAMDRLTEAYRVAVLTGHSTRSRREDQKQTEDKQNSGSSPIRLEAGSRCLRQSHAVGLPVTASPSRLI